MSAMFHGHYGAPYRRGRAALVREDGSMITDDAWAEDSGPGSTITFAGVRYEVVRCLWLSRFVPSCYIVKDIQRLSETWLENEKGTDNGTR